ncbi:DUF2178 domain-containing protein [Haloarcula marina]|uniref:DUF2178 domain-containing protein n=1 Tax=Haloarcula marina TaxID=2961574 RepID=UPI0020B6CF74|nr:DUF2178 domain-containing protein [Halomicroarcula marina]
MTATAHSTTTYRRTYFGLWAVATLAFVALIAADYPLVGVGVFAVGALAATVLQHRSQTVMFDERDTTVFQEAGANTVAVVGLSSAVAFPTLTALWALGLFDWPPWLAHLAWFVTGLFALWGLMLAVARAKR